MATLVSSDRVPGSLVFTRRRILGAFRAPDQVPEQYEAINCPAQDCIGIIASFITEDANAETAALSASFSISVV